MATSSFWNGPEETAKWVAIRKALYSAGEVKKRAVFIYVPFYPARISHLRAVESVGYTSQLAASDAGSVVQLVSALHIQLASQLFA